MQPIRPIPNIPAVRMPAPQPQNQNMVVSSQPPQSKDKGVFDSAMGWATQEKVPFSFF